MPQVFFCPNCSNRMVRIMLDQNGDKIICQACGKPVIFHESKCIDIDDYPNYPINQKGKKNEIDKTSGK